MPHYCLFDLLPVELLHTLFDYFLAHEILLTFSDVSDHVDAVLRSYSAYRLDFKSIQKTHFDLICRHIPPEQVISLTLSDDDDTPGQSELFFSRFRIEQFTHLRNLMLIKIEFELLKYIFFNLHKLDQLRSLSFDDKSIRYRYPPRINPLHCYITNVNIRVLATLNRLNLDNAAILKSMPFPHLRYLKLAKCSGSELTTIFLHASKLKSLYVCLDWHRSNFELILPSNPLTQLSLEIKNYRISINDMRQFLSNLPHLKYLELKASAVNDIANGYQWQTLATSLITFNFKFNVSLTNIGDILESFLTPFWLDEKRWFVAYAHNFLFTIPRFAPVQIHSLNRSHFHSTASDHSVIFNHLNKLIVNTSHINNEHRFTHIKILVLEFSTPFKTLESVIDLNQVEHLIVSSLDNLLTFIPLKCTMPQLYKLTVKHSVTIDIIERIRHYRFEQILKLDISIADLHSDYIIEELFLLFPCVQQLIYKSSIQSKGTMVRVIDGFKYLSNVSFYANASFINRESNFCHNTNTIIQHSRRLIQNNFTCRIYHSSENNSLYNIHWWIGEYPSTHLQKKSWLPRRGYKCFDRLPVELLHTLFNYFSASELLFTFYNINDYVNATLGSYSAYQFDFKSISKSNFRRICHHIRPEQVISLTLSDGNDTPGQSEVFFSRFQIKQFIRLRSLTLIEIEFNSLESIFSNLPHLHQLRSFSFDAYSIRHSYTRSMDLNSRNKLEQINSMLRNTYAQVFPRLNFLYLNGRWALESIPLPNLLYLKLGHCSIDELNKITDLAPELRSLDICINSGLTDFFLFTVVILPSRLTRLNLKIQTFPASMNYMEYLLSNRFYLKHLELHVNCYKDLADGQRWQILTNSLIKLNFKFNVRLDLIEQTLDSFRTSFWLEEKQWFVAYQDECLYSVPYFSPEQIYTSYQPPIHSTTSSNSIFYKNVTKLKFLINISLISVY